MNIAQFGNSFEASDKRLLLARSCIGASEQRQHHIRGSFVANEQRGWPIESTHVASDERLAFLECRVVVNKQRLSQMRVVSIGPNIRHQEAIRPNPPFKPTPLRGHKIGGILKSRSGSNAFPTYSGGAA